MTAPANRPGGPREIIDGITLWGRTLNDDTPQGMSPDEALAALDAYYEGLIPAKIDENAPMIGYKGDEEGRKLLKAWRRGRNEAIDTIRRNFRGSSPDAVDASAQGHEADNHGAGSAPEEER